jgi:tRNA A37 threonylcarbamoyladenosine synthetase subunit TsaC/SUA5/YrdC
MFIGLDIHVFEFRLVQCQGSKQSSLVSQVPMVKISNQALATLLSEIEELLTGASSRVSPHPDVNSAGAVLALGRGHLAVPVRGEAEGRPSTIPRGLGHNRHRGACVPEAADKGE